MKPNPILNKLGFENTDRLIIIHTDDIGMCHASIEAFSDLVNYGLISSGATMVPCSWFPKVANFCRTNSQVDMGVHLTLTSEWDNYRWSPTSTSEAASGLIDEEGYFFRSSEEVQAKGVPSAVQIELNCQISRAINSGIQPTHIDTHMNTVAHPKYVNAYIQLGLQYKTPFLFPRLDEAGFIKLGIDSETAQLAANLVNSLEEAGIPLVDHASGLELDNPINRFDQAKQALDQLKPGITHFIIHPSKDTSELRAITPDWQCRIADYQTFMDDKLRQFIDGIGVHIIGYKALKNAWVI